MTAGAIRGWCPSAHRPMLSGDGLILRIRPRRGRLSSAQAVCIAELAERHGNGLIDLTSRGNLQLRGLRPDRHTIMVAQLAELGLINGNADVEAERNILLAPFWREGDDAPGLAIELEHALGARALGLPSKFGFAVDCGRTRWLAEASADIRIERSVAGKLMVRADGAGHGRVVQRAEAIAEVLRLATWFLASGGASGGRGRMSDHIRRGASLPDAFAGDAVPAVASPMPRAGVGALGALAGIAYGQMQSPTLKFLGARAAGLRLTPWRMILLEGLREMPCHDDIVADADDPRLRISACTGAAACTSAHAETRLLAARLAAQLPAATRLHVSGCAKGCANPGAADLTLVGTAEGFALVRRGTTRDPPARSGLAPEDILADPGFVFRAL